MTKTKFFLILCIFIIAVVFFQKNKILEKEESVTEDSVKIEEAEIEIEESDPFDYKNDQLDMDTTDEISQDATYLESTILHSDGIYYPSMYETVTDYETLTMRFLWSEEEEDRPCFILSDLVTENGSYTISDLNNALEICGSENEYTILDIANYYVSDYQIADPNGSITYVISGEEYYIDGETVADREKTIEYVVDYFGTVYNVSPYTVIRTFYQYVQSAIEYNEDYTGVTTIEALESGYGVCVHYAVCAYILLNVQGIPTRMIAGEIDNIGHLWCECYIDDEWIYVDFTPGTTTDNGIVLDKSIYTEY